MRLCSWLWLLSVRFVLLLAFIIIVIPTVLGVGSLMMDTIIVLFAGVKVLENGQSFLFLHVVVVDELGVVEGDVGEGLAKLVQSIHLVHELG